MGNVEFGIPVLLKSLTDEFAKRQCRCFYFSIPYGKGIDGDEELYNKLEINAERFDLSNNKNLWTYHEYKLYSEDEMKDMIRLNLDIARINRGLDRTQQYENEVKSYLEGIREADQHFGIDLFIVWSMRLRERTIYHYARKHNIPIYIFEHGYFRPFTLTVDSRGINYENSLPRSSDFYLNTAYNEERLQQYLLSPETAVKDEQAHKKYREICDTHRLIEDSSKKRKIGSRLINKLKNGSVIYSIERQIKKYTIQTLENRQVNYKLKSCNRISERLISSGEQFIFVPFQLQTDTQTVLFSPYIKTMKTLVVLMSEAVEKYNEKNEANINVVFKPHPLYKIKEPDMNILEILKVCKKYKNSYFNTTISTTNLIDQSYFVATINSTVGIEALTRGKRVMTLGQAFYNIEGITHYVNHQDKLADGIFQTIHKPYNEKLIKHFLYYIRFHYFSEIFYLHPDSASVERLVDRIMNNMRL